MSLHPTVGVRVLLEREGEGVGVEGGGARYRGSIFTPGERFEFAVVIAGDGAVQVVPASEVTASERARELLRSIAKMIGRHALSEEPRVWPRKVLRWRKVD